MTGSTDGALEHRKVRIGALDLHLTEAGPPDGPPLVLLHGFPEFWYGWHRQIDHFARLGYRVVVPDQRGYNLSDKPRGVASYGLDRLVDDAIALIDACGVDRARVVGHDWGAVVAWWTAVRAPERVERLGIVNVAHPLVFKRFIRENRAQRKRSWYIFFFQLPWLPEHYFRRRNFEKGVRAVQRTARRGTFTDRQMDRYREAWSRPGALTAMIHWYRAALRHPPRRVANPRVVVPTQILWGERDRFLGRELAELSLAMCDDGRLERFPEASHWVQHEEPERVNDVLARFLED